MPNESSIAVALNLESSFLVGFFTSYLPMSASTYHSAILHPDGRASSCTLSLLDLQLFGQFKQDAINQLVVCQLVLRTNPDSAEDIVMDVSIQSFHQFWSRQTRILLQECLHLLPFKSKKDFHPHLTLTLLGFSSINPNDIAISRRGRSDLIRPSSDI